MGASEFRGSREPFKTSVFTAREPLWPLETLLFTAPEPPGVPGALRKRQYLPLRSRFGLLKHRYLPLRSHFVLLTSGFLPYRSLQALRDTPKITKKHETSKNNGKSVARQSSRMLLEINMKMQNPEIPDTPKNPRTPLGQPEHLNSTCMHAHAQKFSAQEINRSGTSGNSRD